MSRRHWPDTSASTSAARAGSVRLSQLRARSSVPRPARSCNRTDTPTGADQIDLQVADVGVLDVDLDHQHLGRTPVGQVDGRRDTDRGVVGDGQDVVVATGDRATGVGHLDLQRPLDQATDVAAGVVHHLQAPVATGRAVGEGTEGREAGGVDVEVEVVVAPPGPLPGPAPESRLARPGRGVMSPIHGWMIVACRASVSTDPVVFRVMTSATPASSSSGMSRSGALWPTTARVGPTGGPTVKVMTSPGSPDLGDDQTRVGPVPPA